MKYHGLLVWVIGAANMGMYYYTPFAKTDLNERRTWNLVQRFGAKFANSANPVEPPGVEVGHGLRKFISPAQLADQLVADRLHNARINLLLFCCFGAGPRRGFELQLIPPSISPPTVGKNLVVVAEVGQWLLFRIFDKTGNTVVNVFEQTLPGKAPLIADLKAVLANLWPPQHKLTEKEKPDIVAAVRRIVNHARDDDMDYLEGKKFGYDTSEQSYTGMSIGKSVALRLGVLLQNAHGLGSVNDVLVRVGGFQGPTHSSDNQMEVTLNMDSHERTHAWDLIDWYSCSGARSNPNKFNNLAASSSIQSLESITDGDQLMVMGHGDWKGGGRILPFSGPTMENFQSKPVNRAGRMKGQAASVK